jgi:protein-L-isoaspartate(D-aspartate) O-methyltransferase
MSELRERFVEQIRRNGVTLSPELAGAFAAVPREAFVAAGFQRREGVWARPGDRVTSIDVQADVVARARAALEQADVKGVEVRHGDGYEGAPRERFDRVIVTVGIAGVSPRWLAQLDGDGPLVAPVEHAGTHPVLAVRDTGPVTATVVCASGFMSAAGPLTARHPDAHPAPAPAGTLSTFAPAVPGRWDGPLDSMTYRDLWYAAGVWHRRATHAALPRRDQSVLALLDETGSGGAAILDDGAVLAGGGHAARYAADAVTVLDRWEAAGRPPMQAWRIMLAPAGRPEAPIWVPAEWTLP